jgi:hypothetical protein
MKTLLNLLAGTVAVVGFGLAAPAMGGPPQSPYGGIMHRTYSSLRQEQEQASRYRYQVFANQPAAESRRSFSYQPTPEVPFKAGDRVTVTSDGANLMRSRDVIAPLRKGQELTILKVQGQWLGTSVTIDGRTKSGWIAARDVSGVKASPAPAPKSSDNSADAPQQPTPPCRPTAYAPTATGQTCQADNRGAYLRDPYGLRAYDPSVPLVASHEIDPNFSHEIDPNFLTPPRR